MASINLNGSLKMTYSCFKLTLLASKVAQTEPRNEKFIIDLQGLFKARVASFLLFSF